MKKLPQMHLDQIELAADGLIYGQLKDWPVLIEAIENAGFHLPEDTDWQVVRNKCRKYLRKNRLTQQDR